MQSVDVHAELLVVYDSIWIIQQCLLGIFCVRNEFSHQEIFNSKGTNHCLNNTGKGKLFLDLGQFREGFHLGALDVRLFSAFWLYLDVEQSI